MSGGQQASPFPVGLAVAEEVGAAEPIERAAPTTAAKTADKGRRQAANEGVRGPLLTAQSGLLIKTV